MTPDGDATLPPEDAAMRARRLRRRLLTIELVVGGLAVLAVLIVFAVGLLGLGDFAHRPIGS